MDVVNIGEFARLSSLSPKALRLYDELGLLPPARVDPDTGYRSYAIEQLGPARLVAALRQIGVPLARIKVVLELEPAAAAEQLTAFWAEAEADHATRRELARHLVDRLTGKRSRVYDVTTRTIPERSVLCLKRHVEGDEAVWALGKEFIALMRERPLPLLDGRAGAAYLIYHGQVSADSDGPVEWCRPVPPAQAGELAARFPELTLRSEPAHEEAVVELGAFGQLDAAQWQLVTDALFAWAAEHRREASSLGIRLTYLVPPGHVPGAGPDIDFAVPLR